MIYEIRTYGLKVGSQAEVIKRYGEAYEHRKKYSELTAFFSTEIGPLNEIIHIWGYESLEERTRIRGAASKDANWPPKIQEFITRMSSEIVTPFPFAPLPKPGKYGPYYEFRQYEMKAGTLPASSSAGKPSCPAASRCPPSRWPVTWSSAPRTGSCTSGRIRASTRGWPRGRRRWPKASGPPVAAPIR